MTYTVGEDSKEVLLLLHGGPGTPCNYLRDSHFPFYSDKGLKVVTFDQLGCGESSQATDPSLWHIERFVEEMEQVRKALNIDTMHLLGHSWGALLGLDYCLKYPDRVQSFVIANGGFNMPAIREEFKRCRLSLGERTHRMMTLREAEGTISHPEYQAAITLLTYRYMCQLEEWPESFVTSMSNSMAHIREKMVSRHAFDFNGSLSTYDRTEQLPKVQLPCLILHAEHDSMPIECATHAKDHLPNAEFFLLRDCSHYACLEKPELYHQIVWQFLEKQLI
ncbi:MAG: proline iminopeptidase-family hydrolase [Gammaproteobacteria bacterium]|nr:proline iminopeptidase-family hydrolase [Gammaproteobacteria bacterium]